jgi:hypothetical protein
MLFCVFYLSIFLVVGLQTEPRTSHVTGLSPSHITSPSLTKSSISLSLYRKSLLVCEWNGCCPSFPLMGFLMGELFTCFVLSIVLMDQIYLLPSSCLGSLKFMSIKFPVYPPGNCLAFTLHSCGMCFLPVFGIMSIFPITSFCLYVCVWGGSCVFESLHRPLCTWLWSLFLLVVVQQTLWLLTDTVVLSWSCIS